ncbi:hypothetical protein [Streptomyces sp. NPDC007991]|uniref:hypothetical protein n=1 Tax=Streptomyces sp. NPDC007991 TaxID=3364803 RepID=UPI0036EBEF34
MGSATVEGYPEYRCLLDGALPKKGESSCPVCRSVNRSQRGPAGIVGLGPPYRGHAERTASAGERSQSAAVRCCSVPSEQLVQRHAGGEVFQHEESESRVGGNDTGSEGDPEIIFEELERRQLGT